METPASIRHFKTHVINNFNAVASHYANVSTLQQEIGNRLLERLSFMQMEPNIIIDLGGGTGYCTNILANQYPNARIINMDISSHMLFRAKSLSNHDTVDYMVVDAEQLALAEQSVDLIISNCAFPWFINVDRTLKEIHRVLKPEGCLFFSTAGPETLKELRQAFLTVDDYPHVNNFIDMHELGDKLLKHHFSDPVVDRDIFKLTYHKVTQLFQDLKANGVHSVYRSQPMGLYTPSLLNQVENAFETYRDLNGLLENSLEIIYGYAMKVSQGFLHGHDEDGIATIPIEDIHYL